MTSPDFNRCMPVTAKWEGGRVDDPDDPGGLTIGGVIQPTYDTYRDLIGRPRQSVEKITPAETLDLYYRLFWVRPGCEGLFPGVDLANFDAGVMSGTGRSKKWLLAAISPTNDHVQTVKNICAKRLSFVEGLKTFWKFGRGWSRRIADVQAKGVAWASAAMQATSAAAGNQLIPVPAERLHREAQAKTKAASRNAKAAGATTVGTGGGGTAGHDTLLDPAHADALTNWLIWGGLALGILLIAFFLWRRMVNRDQAEAFTREAKAL